MKKYKVLFIVFGFVLIFVLASCNQMTDSELIAEEYATIDYFLSRKTDNNHLTVGKYHEGNILNYDEFKADKNDSLYNVMSKIEYVEEKIDNFVVLYKVTLNAEPGPNEKKVITNSIECVILSDNFINITCDVGTYPTRVFKNRTYYINDNDYQELIDEIENVLSIGEIYKK